MPTELAPAWQAALGGRLSSVVVADGKLFVAAIDAHTVHALDADSGKALWSYTAGGRVDSPPTIWQGRVLFGSADGWVYCLRAADGVLAWRFRAAPDERRIMAFEQIESAWPVSGSVLIGKGILCCVAGRSMFLDGGLRLLRLDPKTGQKLAEVVLDDRDPADGKGNLQAHVKGLTMPVALPDVLSSDGKYLYMRSQRFDLAGKREEIDPRQPTEQTGEGAHLLPIAGFLDGTWLHRSYMLFGRSVVSGWGGWYRAGHYAPSGRLLVFDDAQVYGYGRRPEHYCQSSVLEYQLFAADKEASDAAMRRVTQANNGMNYGRRSVSAADWAVRATFPLADLSAPGYKWLRWRPPLHVRAMVLAGDVLFIAGPPNMANEREAFRKPTDPAILAALAEQEAALDGRKGALLWAVSALDGEEIGEYALESPPAWDAMAAAGGRLYLSTVDGKVLCLKGVR